MCRFMNATINNRFGHKLIITAVITTDLRSHQSVFEKKNESQEADKHGNESVFYLGEQVMYHLDSDENESMISSNQELKSQSQPPSIRRHIGSEFEHSSTLCTMRKCKTFLKHKPAFRTYTSQRQSIS